MEKILSRKFWFAAITYVLFTVLFILGKLPVSWFCLSILGISGVYLLVNVWQKQIEGLSTDQILDLIEYVLHKRTKPD